MQPLTYRAVSAQGGGRKATADLPPPGGTKGGNSPHDETKKQQVTKVGRWESVEQQNI